MTDEEIIANWMEPKPEPPPDFGAWTPHKWWQLHAMGGGQMAWIANGLTLDRLWEVEERMINERASDGNGLLDRYRRAMLANDAYFWHASAEQKIRSLAATLRPTIERLKANAR